MTKLYTGRINCHAPDKTVLDTTVKSGKGLGAVFAPTWNMVLASKNGEIDWDEYTRRYTTLLRERYRTQHRQFMAIFSQREVVLTCYCVDSHDSTRHCHRYLLVGILLKVALHHNIDCAYAGEIK